MPTLLIQHATLLVTMDDGDHRWTDGGLFVEDNVIRQVGPTASLPPTADRVISARDHVVLPGLRPSGSPGSHGVPVATDSAGLARPHRLREGRRLTYRQRGTGALPWPASS